MDWYQFITQAGLIALSFSVRYFLTMLRDFAL
jgi:hypothetical protein